jgi:hypothetical protein
VSACAPLPPLLWAFHCATADDSGVAGAGLVPTTIHPSAASAWTQRDQFVDFGM